MAELALGSDRVHTEMVMFRWSAVVVHGETHPLPPGKQVSAPTTSLGVVIYYALLGKIPAAKDPNLLE
ncbi:hypothetical protein ACTMTI_04190 [Nonomuraea sp. H19]|uniref:hypothetical protein n=1 Tax=Nonomuraea sp. H19 TaxID=3452206 RepID=UPI003F8B0707